MSTNGNTELPHVAILIPSMATIHADMCITLCGLATYTMANRVMVSIINERHTYITVARNKLVSSALRQRADYVLFVDTDLIFPNNALIQLMGHDKDIVGASYARRTHPFDVLGKLKKGTDIAAGGVVECDMIPTGLLLVKTDVFRNMKWPWFYETYHRDVADGRDLCDAFFDHLEDSFNAKIPENLRLDMERVDLMKWVRDNVPVKGMLEDNPYIGDDYSFSRKAIRNGYKVWCDIDLTFEVGHLGEQVVAVGRPEGTSTSQEDLKQAMEAMVA